MYDPDGTDTGREWVEVYNDGVASVDLTGVSLVEGGTRHKIASYLGGASTIASGAHAIVADRPELFLADYPGVSPVFDSAFSLSNTGETLALSESAESPDVDSVSWPAEAAATGGKSWQRSGEAWVTALATPGTENADAEEVATTTTGTSSSGGGSGVSTHAETPGLSTYSPPPALKVSAGRVRLAPPRTTLRFDPVASVADRISFRWSWGDGGSSRGKVGRHSYRFPGRYAVVLYARTSLGAAAVSRTTVTVAEPEIAVAASPGDGGFIEIRNGGSDELNLGDFSLRAGSGSFTFPEDSIVLPGASVKVPAETLGFALKAGEAASLRYPEGAEVVASTTTATS
ncbi:MAG: hypothetical protein A3B37_03160 [Candidatus Sungbacteria bacterium RIFCSPLOWO2_01_FULL_59_16]|uniref:PKD domain-containing protein n=1 Tax=Candidatus Sungbacteria bacterium RIFCSPLOWO2_01_FULL_59_16 TaxID=1802280 RepID=A0A1G2L9E2_9BACT|nr:MAG: hypothetical protein A3B37_03160 [Candidatus Sungbacteria bacterium RIFCSPLOWO2_01_FULL_59_16]